MKTSKYRIVPLATEVAEAARVCAHHGAPDHVIVTADSPHGYPCRHCLRWAQAGEKVVLFPYASIPPGRPYSETGPIFVHAAPCERYPTTDGFPSAFQKGRVIRAYDRGQNMIAAEVANGTEPETLIEELLENLETDFIQVRSASRGCYTFGIERL